LQYAQEEYKHVSSPANNLILHQAALAGPEGARPVVQTTGFSRFLFSRRFESADPQLAS
jgi:hypothetical protein